MFIASRAIRKFLYASLMVVEGFNGSGKNGRCACPDIVGIQLELEEQARLHELQLGVAPTVKIIAYTKSPAELGLRTARLECMCCPGIAHAQ